MKEFLAGCRSYSDNINRKREIINTVLIVLFGIISGAAAKLVDNISIDDEILWRRFLGTIDLRNILSRYAVWALAALCIAVYSQRPLRAGVNAFGFLAGMLAGYYAITITVSGFFPKTYMIAWGIITLFTPLPAYFAWYAKGRGLIAVALSSIAAGFFVTQAFSFGMWYFDVSYYAELICLIIALAVLYRNGKQLLLVIAGSFIFAPLIELCLPYVFGGW